MDREQAEAGLVAAALAGYDERADSILAQFPQLTAGSLTCALVLAAPAAAEQLGPENANAAVGTNRWPPLLTLCSSRYRLADPAVRAARLQLARGLLNLGADPNAGTAERDTVRGYRTVLGAAAGRARHPQLVRLLLSHGADAADGPTLYEGCAMWEAVRHRDIESLEALLAAEPPHWHLCHALPQALPYDDIELTRRLLRAGADPNWTMGAWGFGGNCLHEAVVLGVRPAVLEALLEHGAQVGYHDRDGRTPLALAVCLDRRTAAGLLRAAGAGEGDIRDVDRWVGACFAHDGELARGLLAAGIGELRPADHLWLCRAARNGAAQVVALLLQGPVDARSVDDDGQPAVHLAVLAGDAEGCRALLAAGADPWALNYAGQTALDCVVDAGDRATRDELARVLGPAPPRTNPVPFDDPEHAAAFERAADAVVDGDLPSLRALLCERPELATARSSRPHRCTLLHYLAANGVEGERQRTPANAVAVIDLLLAAGSDPNASCYTYRGGPGETVAGLLVGSAPPKQARLTLPMIAALARGGARLDAVYTLLVRLYAGDRVDLGAELGGRALIESVTLGEPTLVKTLLNAGVDIDSRRGDGATALHLAAFEGDVVLVEELLARGADLGLHDNVFHGTPAGWAHAGGHVDLGNTLAKRSSGPANSP